MHRPLNPAAKAARPQVRPNPCRALAAACAAVVGASFPSIAGAQFAIRPIVLSGDASPAGTGTTFAAFDAPFVSDDGRLVFGATVAGGVITASNDKGLFATTGPRGSVPSLFAREGDASPLAGRSYGGAFRDPMLRGGTLLFSNTPTGDTTVALFGGDADAAPGLIGQSSAFLIDGRVNARGDVAFGTNVTTTTGSGTGRQYFVAPRTPTGLSPATAMATHDGNYSAVGEIWLNDHGAVAFSEYFSQAEQGLFLGAVEAPGSRTTVATVGQSAPWVAAGAEYNAVASGALNNLGDAAYVANWSYPTGGGADGLVLRTADGTHQLLVKQGDTAPTGGTFTSSFRHPNIGPMVLTDAGDVIFAARTGTWDGFLADTAIYAASASGMRTIVQESEPVHGIGGTVVYNDLSIVGNGLGVDAAGRILFVASFDDTTTTGLDGGGVMLYDPDSEQIHLVVRSGVVFDVRGDGSVFSVVDGITVDIPSSSDASDHDPMGGMFGNSIAFRLDFRNGMSGIYTATIPEPAGTVAAAGLVAAVLLRRHRGGRRRERS